MKLMIAILLMTSLEVYTRELEINQDHSKIGFEVDYMTLTTVQGSFKKYHGTFNLSASEKELSDINVSIVAGSVDTNEPKRDFHIRGHEFFLVASHPEITFESRGPFAISQSRKIKIPGKLSIKGVTREVVLDGIYKGGMVDPWSKENYFFELSTKINRKDFGMTWNKELDTGGYLVGDEVRIKLSIQAQPSGEKTAFSTHMVPSTKGIVERDQLKKGKIKKLSTSTDPLERPNESAKKN